MQKPYICKVFYIRINDLRTLFSNMFLGNIQLSKKKKLVLSSWFPCVWSVNLIINDSNNSNNNQVI